MKRTIKGLMLAVVLLLPVPLIMQAGFYLVVDQPPGPADAIVVFSGDRGTRMEKAAALYHEGYAPSVLISGGEVYQGVIMARVMKDHALRLGVPEAAVLLEEEADSTYQNAENTLAILQQNHMNNVLVVTSDYHTRRTAWVLDSIYQTQGIHYRIIAADDPAFDSEQWWSSNKSAMNTAKEYIKLTGYLMGRE